jgi:hypothetical protein
MLPVRVWQVVHDEPFGWRAMAGCAWRALRACGEEMGAGV